METLTKVDYETCAKAYREQRLALGPVKAGMAVCGTAVGHWLDSVESLEDRLDRLDVDALIVGTRDTAGIRDLLLLSVLDRASGGNIDWRSKMVGMMGEATPELSRLVNSVMSRVHKNGAEDPQLVEFAEGLFSRLAHHAEAWSPQPLACRAFLEWVRGAAGEAMEDVIEIKNAGHVCSLADLVLMGLAKDIYPGR